MAYVFLALNAKNMQQQRQLQRSMNIKEPLLFRLWRFVILNNVWTGSHSWLEYGVKPKFILLKQLFIPV